MSKSNYLQSLRKKAGLTQAEVSKAFGYTSSQYISNYERNLSHPPVSALQKLSALYGVDLTTLKKQFLKSQVKSFEAKLKKKLGL